MMTWESGMNDGGTPPRVYEGWLRNAIDRPHRYVSTMISGMNTDGNGMNVITVPGKRFFRPFIYRYFDANQVRAFQIKPKPCAKEYGPDPACAYASISWHPSPHRHRVIAEQIAWNIMKYALNILDDNRDLLFGAIKRVGFKPSYELTRSFLLLPCEKQ